MELAFELASCTLRWRFVGASRLYGTLSRRPWEDDGGTILVRVARDIEMDRVLQGIAQSVRAYDGAGAVSLAVQTGLPPDLRVVLQSVINLSPDVRGRRRLEILAESLDRPRVWVLGFDSGPTELADALEQTLEDVRKVARPQHRLCLPLVILAHPERGRAGVDLSVGFPVDSPYGAPGTPEPRLWMIYLHWRIAWFCGGRPGWAEQLDAKVRAEVGFGRDDRLESCLCEVARETWANQPRSVQEQMERWLRAWPTAEAALTRELEQLDLLWHTGHDPERGPQPTPWVARALLARADPPARSLLRACDACEPLATVAISRCLRLEASFKARADSRRGGISDERVSVTHAHLREFRDNLQRQQLIPRTSPSRASLLFDYATLNDTLSFLPDEALRSLAVQVRDVRNAIAHGHPPSWAMVSMIADVWRRMGT